MSNFKLVLPNDKQPLFICSRRPGKLRVMLNGFPSPLNYDTPFTVAQIIRHNLLQLADHEFRDDLEVNLDYSSPKAALSAIQSALQHGYQAFVSIRARYCEKPLSFDSKPYFVVSAFDTSGLVPSIGARFAWYNMPYGIITATNEASRKLIKRGLVPITIYIGNYHDQKDIQELDKISTKFANCIASGIYSFFTSAVFNDIKAVEEDNATISLFDDCDDKAFSASDPTNGTFNSPDPRFLTEGTPITFFGKGAN